MPWTWVAAWLATAVTLVVSAQHTGVSSQWHDDLGLIRSLGMWPLGGQGMVSAVLTQMALWLPAGGCIFRAALVANCGAAVAGLVFFRLLHDMLAKNAYTPRLGAWLSMFGSLLLTLSLPMQRAATVAGGAAVAVALCMSAIWLHSGIGAELQSGVARRRAALVGGLVVAAIVEQVWAGVVALLVIGIQRGAIRGRGDRGQARSALLGAGLTLAAFCVPLLCMLRPHRLIPELPSLSVSLQDSWRELFRVNWGGVHWWHDAGLMLSAMAFLGGVWGAAKAPLRFKTSSWLGVLALASCLGSEASALRESPVSALRVMASAAVIVLATLAAQTLALLLLRSRVSFVGASVVVVLALDAMLVAVHADDADVAAESRLLQGNDVFTQEAIWALPHRSVVLVRHRELAYRFWAERLSHGMRPDILVVTPERLQHRPDLTRLLALEPALAPLIREWVIRGRPSEYVLSQLADARPLFVELDSSWDARLREHLSAWGLWSEFHSQSLGRSDRYAKMTSTRSSVDRVIEVCKGSVPPDSTTLHFVSLRLREHSLVSASLGDRPGVYPLLEELDKAGTEKTFVVALSRLLDEKPHGPIDWAVLSAL